MRYLIICIYIYIYYQSWSGTWQSKIHSDGTTVTHSNMIFASHASCYERNLPLSLQWPQLGRLAIVLQRIPHGTSQKGFIATLTQHMNMLSRKFTCERAVHSLTINSQGNMLVFRGRSWSRLLSTNIARTCLKTKTNSSSKKNHPHGGNVT